MERLQRYPHRPPCHAGKEFASRSENRCHFRQRPTTAPAGNGLRRQREMRCARWRRYLEGSATGSLDPQFAGTWDDETAVTRTSYAASLTASLCPRILTVCCTCSVLSGFFKTVIGPFARMRSSISLSG